MFPTSNYNRRFYNKKTERYRTPTIKIVTFKVGQETYAIAIDRVVRVLTEFTPHGVLESGRSLIKYDGATITIWDLSILLFPGSSDKIDCQYLIVCTLENGDSVGIPIPELPAILDVREDKFEALPTSYREGTYSSIKAPEALEKLIYTESGAAAFYLNLDKLIAAS